MRYRIAEPFSPQRFGLLWLSIVATVGLAIVISVVAHIPTATLIIAPGLFLAVRRYLLSSAALLVDRAGVRVGDVSVPWGSVAQLVVFEPARRVPNAEVWVGVGLRPDAPLPPGATPADRSRDPNILQFRGPVPARKLNLGRLTATVRGFASQVPVTVRHGQPDDAASSPPVGTP